MHKRPGELRGRLNKLHQLLATAQDFEEPFRYFHDELMGCKEFAVAGETVSSPIIQAAVRHLTARVAPYSGNFREIRLIRLEPGFYHGLALFDGALSFGFYFQDGDQGLWAIKRSLFDPLVEYVRFSLQIAHNCGTKPLVH